MSEPSTKKPVESYGITYVPTAGTFAGVRIPVMSFYGFAIQFKSMNGAMEYAKEIFTLTMREYSVKVEGGTYCAKLVAIIVETLSGRTEICSVGETRRVFLRDPYKPTYKKLLPILLAGRKLQADSAKRAVELKAKRAREDARRSKGTALEFD